MKKIVYILILIPAISFGQLNYDSLRQASLPSLKSWLSIEGAWKDSTRANLYAALANRPTLSRVHDSLQDVRNTINGVVVSVNSKVSATTLNDSTAAFRATTNGLQASKSTIYFGTDAGANDSYSITASPAPASYTTGMMIVFRANTQNTTGCTINVNGLGVKTIVKRVSTTPATGDILAQMFCWLVYDGANFVLLNPVVN